jgi:hypothetical protein
LADSDLDTGAPTHRGEYDLADETYDELLRKLAKENFANVSPELKEKLLTFYDQTGIGTGTTKENRKSDKQTEERSRMLEQLRGLPTDVSVPLPTGR